LAVATLASLPACTTASPAPKGWQPVPGASGAWSSGSGPNGQQYVYSKKRFAGMLPDLASQVTINALMQNRGAKFRGSVPFAPCPGAAGVATFQLRDRITLQEGFAVRNGEAVRVTYIRPSGTPVDPSVTQAMQNALCAL
jgi:hypothetical protein